MTQHIAVVLNPAAGGGRGEAVWRRVAPQLQKLEIDLAVHRTVRRGHGTDLAREALLNGATTILVIGGDGTINEILNGFLQNDVPLNPDARLAVLAGGTGNDIARQLGLPPKYLSLALGPTRRTGYIDVLHVEYETPEGDQICRYALGHVISGVLAEAVMTSPRSVVKRLGQIGYLWSGMQAVLRNQPREVIYLIDGTPAFSGLSHGGLVANAQTLGAGFRAAEHGRLDDGQAEVALVGLVGRPRLLTQLIPQLRNGSYRSHPAVSHWSASSVTLQSPVPIPVALDGEFVGFTPAHISVLPGVLPCILPPGGARCGDDKSFAR